MSVTDPSAEPVQPEEGQGGEEASGGGSPWESYLERFPEDVRDTAADAFREMEGNATKRFQEHADYKQSWAPYEQLGVNQLPPEDLQWALEFRQAAVENPQAIQEWFQTYAEQHGLTPQEAAAVEQQGLENFGFEDPNAQLEQMLSQRLSPFEQQLGQLQSVLVEQQQQQAQQAAQQFIEGQLAELEEKHGGEFNREGVEMFVANFIESDPEHAVPRAWEAYQGLQNQIEKRTLQAKADAPAPAEGGGVPDVSPDRVTNFKDAREQAVQFLKNNNRA